MFAVCCLSFVDRCLLFVVCCVLFVVCCVFAVRRFLFAVCGSLCVLVARCLKLLLLVCGS